MKADKVYSPWVINMSVLIGLYGIDWIYYLDADPLQVVKIWGRLN